MHVLSFHRPAIRAALRGCGALLEREAPLAVLTREDAISMAKALVEYVFIQALAVTDRIAALNALRTAVERYGQTLLDADIDLLEFVIASVDGEKDPRCLLHAFGAMRAVLELYARQKEDTIASGRLEESCDEAFDVLSCYFPVSFTPPSNDPHGITREQIARQLESTLAAVPLFSPLVIPLITNKLSSTLRTAKMDALSLLESCAASYGFRGLQEHYLTIWMALKHEILGDYAEEGKWQVDGFERANEDDVTTAAVVSLTRCTRAFEADDLGFVKLVLQDQGLQDTVQCIASPGTDALTFRRSVRLVQGYVRVLGGLAAADGKSSQLVATELFPKLLDMTADAISTSRYLAWVTLWCILSAMAYGKDESCHEAIIRSPSMCPPLIRRVIDAAVSQLATNGTDRSTGAEKGEGYIVGDISTLWQVRNPSDCDDALRMGWLQMSCLQAIFSSAFTAAISIAADGGDVAINALEALLAMALSPASPPSLADLAASTLANVAAGPLVATVQRVILPRLVERVSNRDPGLRRPSLAVLQRLQVMGDAYHVEVMATLDETTQLYLLKVAAEPDGVPESCEILQDVLKTAADLMHEYLMAEREDRVSEACFAQMALHTFETVCGLDPSQSRQDTKNLTGCLAALTDPLSRTILYGAQVMPESGQEGLAGTAAAVCLNHGFDTTRNEFIDLMIAAACALLLSMRQGPASRLFKAHGTNLLAALVDQALSGRTIAAVTLQSLINKLDDDSGVEAAAESVIERVLSRTTPDTLGVLRNASVLLAGTIRALAVRGHQATDRLIQYIVNNRSVRWEDSVTVIGDVISQRSPNDLDAAYAIMRPGMLWRQRTYMVAAKAIESALNEANAASESSTTIDTAPWLRLTYAYLLAAAPQAVLRADAERALPALAMCLSASITGGGTPVLNESQRTHILGRLLRAVCELLDTDVGRLHIQRSLNMLIPVILQSAAYAPAMGVREAALECLVLLSKLPYTALHPYKKDVVRTAGIATDDRKRSVRTIAVRCREAWTASDRTS